jgi:hypothetical protein
MNARNDYAAYNKGEWSEPYVVLRVLADGKLYQADKHLGSIPGWFTPVLEVIRDDAKGRLRYVRNDEIKVVYYHNGSELIHVPLSDFANNADLLLRKIKAASGPSFPVPELETFLNNIYYTKIKGSNLRKTDIVIKIHDIYTGQEPELSYSIKSFLGGSSTLFNSSGNNTNVVFEIVRPKSITDALINEINAISTHAKIKDRLKAILKAGCELKFLRIDGCHLEANLQVIDSRLPEIVAMLLLVRYIDNENMLEDLVNILEKNNPLQYKRSSKVQKYYSYKIKSMLYDMALGMTASKPWSGLYDITGGYIVIKTDGDVLCFNFIRKNVLQDYLLENTYLDTPASERHKFGKIAHENGHLIFKLNFQIRFKT